MLMERFMIMKITEVKKKDGAIVYRASVCLGIDQVTGKKVKISVTGKTQTEVKQKAKHAQFDFIFNGSTICKEAQIRNYQELAELWLKSYQLTVKPQTYVATKRMLYNHLIPVFGSMKIDKLTVSYIQHFINDLSSQSDHYGVVHSTNRRVLQYGVSLQLIPKNYSRLLKLLGTPKSKARIRAISIDKKTVNMLKLYKKRQRQLFLEVGDCSPKVVFATPTKEYQNMATSQECLNR